MSKKLLPLIAVILCTLAFTFANAQGVSPGKAAQSKAKVTTSASAQIWSWIKPRLSVSAYMVTASSFEGDFKLSDGQSGTASFSGSNSFGLQAQLDEYNKWDRLGVYTNLSLEQEREFSSIRFKNLGAEQAGAKLKTFVLGAGLQYSLSNKIYFPAGLNLPVLSETSKGSLDSFGMSPKIGVQMGAGLKIKNNLSGEFLWRRLVFDGSGAKNGVTAKFTDMKLEGFNLQGRYSF